MQNIAYFGRYYRFNTLNKKDSVLLISPDCIIGDTYSIEIELSEHGRRAWIINPFKDRIGFLDETSSLEISEYLARDYTLVAFLSFVAFTESPEGGYYWGEIAVIGYKNSSKVFVKPFSERVAKLISEGTRPDLELSDQGLKQLQDNPNSWMTSKRNPIPKMKKGSALVKTKKSIGDYFIQQGRAKNKGCYFLSWLFILAAVTLVLFSLKSCGLL